MAEVIRQRFRDKEFSIAGKQIAIIGGGPAGSFLAYLLAKRGVQVTIYESRSPNQPEQGELPEKCTGCAGVIQDDALKLLQQEDIYLPPEIIQAEINDVRLHLPHESTALSRPTHSVAVFRNFSPVIQPIDHQTQSFDAFILQKAKDAGATHIQVAVSAIDLKREDNGKVMIVEENGTKDNKKFYDMVVGAAGHNFGLMDHIDYGDNVTHLEKPKVNRAIVREYRLPEGSIKDGLKNKMHIFPNPTPRIWFTAVVDKGEYVSIVVMGKNDVGDADLKDLYKLKEFKDVVGNLIKNTHVYCGCSTNTITVKSSSQYMAVDQKTGEVIMVTIGDMQGSRIRKNGIGGALFEAKQLADALLDNGNGIQGLDQFRQYINREYVWDNYIADFILRFSDFVIDHAIFRKLMLYFTTHPQPFITPALLSVIDHLATGKTPYWRIPFDMLSDGLAGQN